ncbi:MAG: hypothetical protein ACI86H_001631, partial [bacterium]
THNGTEVETLHMEDSGKTYVPEKPDEHESLRVPEREDESDEEELEAVPAQSRVGTRLQLRRDSFQEL